MLKWNIDLLLFLWRGSNMLLYVMKAHLINYPVITGKQAFLFYDNKMICFVIWR